MIIFVKYGLYFMKNMDLLQMRDNSVALYITQGFWKEINDVPYAEEKGIDEIWMGDPGLERDIT